VAESTISLIEGGKRAYTQVGYADVMRLARALGVDPELLFPVPANKTARSETPDKVTTR